MKQRVVIIRVEVEDDVTDEQIIAQVYGTDDEFNLDFQDVAVVDPTD